MEASNVKAIREALITIRDKAHKQYINDNGIDTVWIQDVANAALAAPPRQCDVGTAEEQLDRYGLFCQNKCPICDNRHSCHICGERYRMKCMMKWTQMPYNESEMAK